MNANTNRHDAVELLQELGLKEYEAKSFVALNRLPTGTAKEISEISDVPRTRVYDAIRVLESKGLVETQHSSPQQFRAVDIDEAIRTLRLEYEERIESLRVTLEGVDQVEQDGDGESTQEVWTLAGRDAIATRTAQLVEGAEEEVCLVLGRAGVLTERLRGALGDADRRDVAVAIGTIDETMVDATTDETMVDATTDQTIGERVQDALPGVDFDLRSGLDWLPGEADSGDDTRIGRLLLVDGSTLLVSSCEREDDVDDQGEEVCDGTAAERAVLGRGFDNGIVTVVRRLLGTCLGDDAPESN